MHTLLTTQEFIEKFPRSKLNINNQKINNILSMFIIKNSHILHKSWQTISTSLKFFFKSHDIHFPMCNDRKPEFWTSRGWDNPREKILETGNPLPTSKVYWLKKGYSEIESELKTQQFYKEKIKGKRVLPTQLEYYINQGQTLEDATQSLKNEQANRASKLVEKELNNPELRKKRLWSNIEYYTSKGYSEEEGYELMAEKFKSRELQTMEKLISKYILKGFSTEDAIYRAKDDYKKRSQKSMNTKIKNNSFAWNQASKQSIKFFEPLMKKLNELNIPYHIGMEHNEEFFLAKGLEYFYSYDFCIPSMKLIIEYNGEHIHPNPNMSKEDWKNWKHCWTKKTADECRDYDQQKIKKAEEHGYKVIEVFESDVISSLELITF